MNKNKINYKLIHEAFLLLKKRNNELKKRFKNDCILTFFDLQPKEIREEIHKTF
jgi:hypothetical protein